RSRVPGPRDAHGAAARGVRRDGADRLVDDLPGGAAGEGTQARQVLGAGPARALHYSQAGAHHRTSLGRSWVAFDRVVRAVERFGRTGPVERWRQLRDAIHDEVCRKGFDPKRNTFAQSYGSEALDASLLMIPLVGFLPPDDPRVRGTVEAI